MVGYGCTTCIGNSGPLTEVMREAMAARAAKPGGRAVGQPQLPRPRAPRPGARFPHVAAAGDRLRARGRCRTAPARRTGADRCRRPACASAISGRGAEIEASWRTSLAFPDDFRATSRGRPQPGLAGARRTGRAQFPWDPASTDLRRPPFASVGRQPARPTIAFPLLIVGDDVTTDHISPASGIPRDSEVADFLVEQGEDRDDLNVFASRRGNWEVMVRAAFYSKSLDNLLAPDAPVGHTLHNDHLSPRTIDMKLIVHASRP